MCDVGGWISERGDTWPDTRKRVSKGFDTVRRVAKAWSMGTKRGRGEESGIVISARLKTLRAIVIPTITSFSRSRAWTEAELRQLQRVAHYAVRRAMGMDLFRMADEHISDECMYRVAGWASMGDTIRKLTLQWAVLPVCPPRADPNRSCLGGGATGRAQGLGA